MKKTDIASTAPRVAAGDPTDWNLPDLNLLKVFGRSTTKVARAAPLRLGVTQSAVSAALARLRALYGDPLFTRTGRGLAPSLRARELRPVIGEALDRSAARAWRWRGQAAQAWQPLGHAGTVG